MPQRFVGFLPSTTWTTCQTSRQVKICNEFWVLAINLCLFKGCLPPVGSLDYLQENFCILRWITSDSWLFESCMHIDHKTDSETCKSLKRPQKGHQKTRAGSKCNAINLLCQFCFCSAFMAPHYLVLQIPVVVEVTLQQQFARKLMQSFILGSHDMQIFTPQFKIQNHIRNGAFWKHDMVLRPQSIPKNITSYSSI